MTKDLIIMALGVWVALVPFLGLPNRWDTIIFAVSGLLIVVFVLLLRRDFVSYIRQIKARHLGGRRSDSFVENDIHQTNPLESFTNRSRSVTVRQVPDSNHEKETQTDT